MNVSELVYYSGLNSFLNTKDNLVRFDKKIGNSYIIGLNLYQREISYIKNNFEDFKKVLETVLYTINHSSENYYNNITFNSIKFGEKLIKNCVFLYNSKNADFGFINTNKFIEYKLPKKKKSFLGNTYYDKIGILIETQKLSVRNLMKLGIIQIKARKIYNFLKEKEVFVILEHNQNHKNYNIENYKKIGEKIINEMILE